MKKLTPNTVNLKYCGGENNTPRVIFDPHPLNESLDRYIAGSIRFLRLNYLYL